MRVFQLTRNGFLGLLALCIIAPGCGPQADDGGTQVSQKDEDKGEKGEEHDHGGWWCTEHGLPEEECSMCSSAAAEKFKEKGDWCEEHGRAESQCFKCDPSRAAKFAKLYEAKFGHAPPEPTE